MEAPNRRRVLLESPAFCLGDSYCRPGSRAAQAEKRVLHHMILFPRRGVFIHDGRRVSVVADPNHVLFLNRNDVYRTDRLFELGHDARWIRLEAEYLIPLMRSIDPEVDERPHQLFRFGLHFSSPQLHLMMTRLFHLLEGPAPHDPIVVQSRVEQLLHHLISEASAGWNGRSPTAQAAPTQGQVQAADDVKTILAMRFHEQLPLEAIAREVHISVFHLCRVFKSATGRSIHQYLNRLRLRAALEQLHEARGELAALARGVGFSSHSHFTAAFRREFGLSPSAFRSQHPPAGARPPSISSASRGS